MAVRVEAAEQGRGSRLAVARDRARRAKLLLGSLAALAFGVGYVGAKTHAPSHAKGRLRPLSAPSSFEQAVRQSALSAGSIAPPQQPPAVVSSVS
jgi:hypothetical protein